MLHVKAIDAEAGEYGVVKYSLSLDDSSPNSDHFQIDEDSGVISVAQTLNYISQSSYRYVGRPPTPSHGTIRLQELSLCFLLQLESFPHSTVTNPLFTKHYCSP